MRRKPFYRWLAGWLLLSMLLGVLVAPHTALMRSGAGSLFVRDAHAAPHAQGPMSIVISEVAWAGTQASSDDDWIELYNPGATEVDISGWDLISNTFSITFPTPTIILPNRYYLIERRQAATSIAANLVSASLLLGNDGDVLRLRDVSGTLVDSANLDGGPWPAGTESPAATMERDPTLADSDTAWVTYGGAGGPALDAANNPIFGSPTRNQIATLTPTPITPTLTSVVTPSRTATPTQVGLLSVVINEVAWAGTGSSEVLANDEWIELYNPGTKRVNISRWELFGNDFKIVFPAGTVIEPKKFFLIEIREQATNIKADLIFSNLDLHDVNERLYLFDTKSNKIIDRANFDGGAWPAGSSSNHATMERGVIAEDNNRVWVTYDANRDNGTKAKNAEGSNIRGTPGRANRPINVTATSTPIPTSTPRPRFSTALPPLPPILGISEFLPRPGFDWNNDGQVDVFDEFVEIINAGQIDVNLSAYRLDDEENRGSLPFTLPNITLKPNERAVFYASETGILLSDAGETVRLLRGSTVVDAYTYSVPRTPDQSWCRLPDRMGYWNDPCFPTPNNPNALTGEVPLPPIPVTGYQPVACLLPDTTPDVFIYAECEVRGSGIWNRQYWDSADSLGPIILDEEKKWITFFE